MKSAVVALTLVGVTIAPASTSGTPLSGADRRCFQVSGPDDSLALVNLTPISGPGAGHGLLVSADVVDPAPASNVNFVRPGVDPNLAASVVGADGGLCYRNWLGDIDLVVDDLGSVVADAYTTATPNGEPLRVLDTRIDGDAMTPRQRRCFTVAGRPGDAALVNLTPVAALGAGHGQLVSSDVAEPPVASNVNFALFTVDPNVAIAPLGADGKVCFVNSEYAAVHLVADHLATIHAESFSPATAAGTPHRTIDTRADDAPIGPDGRLCFAVAGRPGDAALVNLTPVEALGPGHAQLVSSDIIGAPLASHVNFAPGSVDPNVAIAPLGADGEVCFVNSEHSTVHLVVDHLATLRAEAYVSATEDGTAARVVDTREG
ncbi:MAG: hypothetical protein HKN41_01440 [Ilumatobacter sp.]|nr:hypothetical protein [Ilumatobacter sp.]